MKSVGVALLVVFLVAFCSACARQAPSPDWMTYNGPLSGDRYSPLAEITTANVGQMRPMCAFDAPEAVNFQSGIVAVNGVLYFTLFNHTYAVDGATCSRSGRTHVGSPTPFSW